MTAESAGEPRPRWIEIQLNTFTNWLNEQLGCSARIRDLTTDLASGVLLIHIVERLQRKSTIGKVYMDKPTEIQRLMNVQMALDALRRDGVRLVNIGSHDVVGGNVKLLLGLIWSLIQRYQITAARTKIPAKKLVMAWIQSVLPSLSITNFRTAWNSGRALSALVHYCRDELCPDWRMLKDTEALENCENALGLASRHLGVPQILSPEDLSSLELDELSCLAYLSYFVRPGGPGYQATLQRVRHLLLDDSVADLSSSWTDGRLLNRLICLLKGIRPVDIGDSDSHRSRQEIIASITMALMEVEKLGVRSLLSAEDIADSHNNHLGVMALVAALCSTDDSGAPFPPTQCFQHQQVNLDLAFAEGDEVPIDELTVEVFGPNEKAIPESELAVSKERTRSGARLSLIPTRVGPHKVRIRCLGRELPSSPLWLHVFALSSSAVSPSASSLLEGSPSLASTSLPSSSDFREEEETVVSFAQKRAFIVQKLEGSNTDPAPKAQVIHRVRDLTVVPPPLPATPPPPLPASSPPSVDRETRGAEAEAARDSLDMPQTGLVSFSGLTEPCPVGSIVQVAINTHGDAKPGSLLVEAVAPSGRVMRCDINWSGHHYMASFTPKEVGTWKIGILYDGDHIRSSPFNCDVFDASAVRVFGLDVGLVGQQLTFSVDTTKAGAGNLEVSVLRLGRELPSQLFPASSGLHSASFVPDGAGQYNIHVLFNKIQIQGSPFILDIADASSVSVYGDNLRVASVDKLASFIIHAAGADPKDIAVTVTGEHSIDVRLCDQSIFESPFICNVGDAEAVTVRGMPRHILSRNIGQDHSFEIDASAAGSGNLEIMINGGRVPCRVRELGSRQYLAMFTPSQQVNHIVEMRFNGEEVRGSPWNIAIEEQDRMEIREHDDRMSSVHMSPRSPNSFYSEIAGPGLVKAAVGKPATFEISGDRLQLEDIRSTVTTPDGLDLPVRMMQKGIGKFVAEYRIQEVGEHQLNVWINGRRVDTTPLFVAGYAAERVKLEPLGGGAPGQPVQFIVDAVDAGKGQLEISVNQGRVPNNVQMQGAGRCLVTFIPQQAGVYVIDVTFNGELVHGCPIRVEILPKQVGQAVAAPIHHPPPQTTSPREYSSVPGIAGGHAPQSSSFVGAGPRSPTSPTLLRHARQHSTGSDHPRSSALIRAIDTTSPRSYSTSSPRYESTAMPKWTTHTGEGVTPSSRPSGIGFSPRQGGSEWTLEGHQGASLLPASPVRETTFYERRDQEGMVSPSGQHPVSVYPRSRSSPTHGERARKVEELDPLADEAERESRKGAWQRDQTRASPPPAEKGVGFTVAQYGEPRSTSERPRVDTTGPRPEIEELEYGSGHRKRSGEATWQTGNGHSRRESPTYSSVYERRYERIEEPGYAARDPGRPQTPPRDFDVSPERGGKARVSAADDKVPFHTSYVEEKKTYSRRTVSPDDMGTRLESSSGFARPTMFVETETERTVSPGGAAEVVETTTTRTTTYSVSPRSRGDRVREDEFARPPHEPAGIYENVDRRPVVPRRHSPERRVEETTQREVIRRVATERDNESREDRPDYARTQSETRFDEIGASGRLERSREVENIYDQLPSSTMLSRVGELPEMELSEKERRTAEYLKVKDEDDRIFEKHGFRRGEEPISERVREAHFIREGEDPNRPSEAPRSAMRGDPREDERHFNRSGDHSRHALDEHDLRHRKDLPESARTVTHDVRKDESPERRAGEMRPIAIETEDVDRQRSLSPRTNWRGIPEDRLPLNYVPRSGEQLSPNAASLEESDSSLPLYEHGSFDRRPLNFVPKDDQKSPRRSGGRSESRESRYPHESRIEEPIDEHMRRAEYFDERGVDAGGVQRGMDQRERRGRSEEPIRARGEAYEIGSRGMESPQSEAEERAHSSVDVSMLSKSDDMPHSPPVSAPTTPRISSKFKKGADGGFDFGKSKFVTKNEVVKRGKDVELKLDSLKLGKEDTLRVVIMGPIRPQSGEPSAEIDPKVKKSGSKYEISFRPTDVGTHKVFAYVNDQAHPASPFPIRVYDPAEIVVGDIPHQSQLNDTVEFTVDAGRAGFGNLEMAIKDADGVIIPSHVAQLESGSAKFLVTFSPTTTGKHTVNITFNKEVLKSSPFEVLITEAAQLSPVSAAGSLPPTTPELSKKDLKKEKEERKREEKERAKREKEEKVATLKKEKELKKMKKGTGKAAASVTKIPSLSRVGVPSTIQVHTVGQEPLEISVTDAKKEVVDTNVKEVEPGLLHIEFTPVHVGDHEISVRYGGVAVSGSPFTCRAYDPAKIHVGAIPNGVAEQPVHFVVDASQAGVGNLEVAVNEGKIPSMANGLGQHRYDISFVPREQIDHFISVRFNNEPVPGSPFVCKMVSASSVSTAGAGLERVPVDEPACFSIQTLTGTAPPTVRIRGPNGAEVRSRVEAEGEPGSFVISYTPTAVGNYTIEIDHEEEAVAGSPFTAKAFDARLARLAPSEEPAVVGQQTSFLIDAANAGAGNMEIIVSVDGHNVPNFVKSEGQAKFLVSFTPQEPKQHNVSVRFNGIPVPGSPMTVAVTGKESGASPAARAVTSSGLLGASPASRRAEETEIQTAQVGQKNGFSIPNVGRGDCNVIVTAPDGAAAIPAELVKGDSSGAPRLDFSYTPTIPGDHHVEIFGRDDEGDEMLMRAFPLLVSQSLKERLPDLCLAGKKYSFEIETLNRHKEAVHVDIRGPDGRALPIQMEDLPGGGVRASTRFKDTGVHSVDIFVDETSLETRQSVLVLDPAQAVHLLDPLPTPILGHSVTLSIHVNNALQNVVEAQIHAPDGSTVPCRLAHVTGEEWELSWKPRQAGPHEVLLLASEVHVADSPLAISVLDLSAVVVLDLRAADSVGTDQKFSVDFLKSGAREARVAVNREGSGEVHCEQRLAQGGLLACSFSPRLPGIHLINVAIDGVLLPECPYEIAILATGAARATGDALRLAQRGRTATFEVSVGDARRGDLDVTVSDAAGGPLPVRCYKQHDDSYWVEFTPEDIGTHTIEVTFGDVPIAGSPFKCTVIDPKKVRVTGLEDPLVLRHAATVTVSKEGAGMAELSVEVADPEGANLRTECLKSPSGDNRITFLPRELGPHRVTVKLGGFQVPGFPKTVYVDEEPQPSLTGPAITKGVVAGESAVLVFDSKKQAGGIKINVTGPDGVKVVHRVERKANGHTEISFPTDKIGVYNVALSFNSQPIQGSPFRVEVFDGKKMAESSEVLVRGIEKSLSLRKATTLSVERSGLGKLEVEITDPTGRRVKTDQLKSPSGHDRFTFLPSQLGEYTVDVRVAGHSVRGYPQRVVVEEEAAPAIMGAALDLPVRLGQPASFIFDPKGNNGGIKVDVRAPGGRKVRHTMNRRPNGTSEVVFYPDLAGSYDVLVDFNSRPVAGSPFIVSVVDPSKVLVNDENMDRKGRIVLAAGQRNVIDVDVTAAGPGKLRAEVEDADGREVGKGPVVEEAGQGKLRVVWNPRHAGAYQLYLTYGEAPVDDANPLPLVALPPEEAARALVVAAPTTSSAAASPSTATSARKREERETMTAMAASPRGESAADGASRVLLRGDGIQRPLLNEPNDFIIDASDCHREGHISASLTGQKVDVPVRLSNIGQNIYKASYTPLTPGRYELRVEWDGVPVAGTPIPISFLPSPASAADLISVDSSTLKIGIINDDVKTLIDTRKAGPGQLSAQCMGPAKLAYCELYDHRDGTYTLSVKPTEVGKHTLTIKYNEKHVPGSPFLVHVSLPPDASKVRVYGPGIEHGILSIFKSNFVVETRGAGAGQLTVRVRGPKGAFNVEMQREKKNERTIHCKYEPREPGDYQVEVKWHGEHVPGSPFLVMIVDTEQELSRFMRGEAPSPTPATPFVPPGWVGGPPPPPLYLHGGHPRGPPFYPPPPGAIMAPPGPYGPHPGTMPPPQRHRGKYANGL